MKIKVKFIGRYKDMTGKKELEIDISGGDSIWHAIESVVKHYPQLERDKRLIIVSKNSMLTSHEAKIADGDEITLTPPVVSGG